MKAGWWTEEVRRSGTGLGRNGDVFGDGTDGVRRRRRVEAGERGWLRRRVEGGWAEGWGLSVVQRELLGAGAGRGKWRSGSAVGGRSTVVSGWEFSRGRGGTHS